MLKRYIFTLAINVLARVFTLLNVKKLLSSMVKNSQIPTPNI
jgi:hypothetical protein